MRISYLLLGDRLWQLRLPTFIASLLLIICVFLLGRSFYGVKVGWVATIIVAFLPTVVLRSVSARGYIIVTLMTLLGFLAADYIIRKRNLFGWLFLTIACAIGFYAIPIMLFPCGLIFVWLLLVGITKETSNEYRRFFDWVIYLVGAGLSIVVLVFIFYSPILLTNNLREIYAYNRVLQPSAFGDFFASFPATIQGILMEWSTGISKPIIYILLAGLCLSILFYKRDSKYRIPIQFIFIIYIVVMILVERPYPITRIWLWVVPLLAIWSGAGIVGGLQWISEIMSIRLIAPVFLILLLLGFMLNGIYQSYLMSELHQSSEDPAAQKVTLFLKPLLTKDSYVAVSGCSDSRYWYYFQFYRIPDFVIRNRNRFFDKVYIIAYTKANPSCGNEEALKVFADDGPDQVFFDLKSMRVIKQIDYATVYEVDPILERVKKAYPNH
jgi:4-amino-4-deoxy-L-arabinose transferase-like glycosyltransferase